MLENDKKMSLTQKEFMVILNTIKSFTTINSLMTGSSEAVQVKHSLYVHFPAVGAFDFKNSGKYHGYKAPQETKDYFKGLTKLKEDPVISHTLASGNFIWLSDTFDEGILINSDHEKRIRTSLKFIGDGICCPLYGPDNRKGYAFVGFGRSKAEFDAVMPYQIQSILQVMHVQYCMLMRGLQKQVKLTSREAEVLELISYGKSSPDIALILGISSRTVAVHTRNIFIKLDTTDRVSAAMRAQTIEIKI